MLEDASIDGMSPSGWAGKAVALFHRLKADCLVAEVNFGGDMVRAVIQNVALVSGMSAAVMLRSAGGR